MTRKNEVTMRGWDGTPLLTVPCTFVDVAGIRLAVHRFYRSRHGGGHEMMRTRDWAVTEPQTGHSITKGWSSREDALQAAHARINSEGGTEAVRELIARKAARLAGADLV